MLVEHYKYQILLAALSTKHFHITSFLVIYSVLQVDNLRALLPEDTECAEMCHKLEQNLRHEQQQMKSLETKINKISSQSNHEVGANQGPPDKDTRVDNKYSLLPYQCSTVARHLLVACVAQ